MNINIELNEKDLREMVARFISERTGTTVTPDKVNIEIKSKQNYKSEWEQASFRARYTDHE